MTTRLTHSNVRNVEVRGTTLRRGRGDNIDQLIIRIYTITGDYHEIRMCGPGPIRLTIPNPKCPWCHAEGGTQQYANALWHEDCYLRFGEELHQTFDTPVDEPPVMPEDVLNAILNNAAPDTDVSDDWNDPDEPFNSEHGHHPV